ncbi:phosphatase [Taibaiella sp. KBW10]|uniref:D-glycero-alpha-D-manno-heptose-1,7-bisphosphate 7-phosphatase n=1 Tax=Taibaiella sp. KBW10 TaxID=2153357 RepID=UPI000F5A1D65|nr:HAD family hydrolase [Taibaiella sp. KBW10]RQO32478.1 phosphatase [Taibaiella sp. KBW10]
MKVLFLDRDGVINVEKDGSYIFKPSEVSFYEGALEAICHARQYFDLTLVVTNQRGIGKGLMTEPDLHEIHQYINSELEKHGGRIDGFYFAPALASDDAFRKPNTGMALQAQKDYPAIDFSASVMVGNNFSDMKFGKAMGMKTVFLHTTQEQQALPNEWIDAQFDSLAAWSNSL